MGGFTDQSCLGGGAVAEMRREGSVAAQRVQLTGRISQERRV